MSCAASWVEMGILFSSPSFFNGGITAITLFGRIRKSVSRKVLMVTSFRIRAVRNVPHPKRRSADKRTAPRAWEIFLRRIRNLQLHS